MHVHLKKMNEFEWPSVSTGGFFMISFSALAKQKTFTNFQESQ